MKPNYTPFSPDQLKLVTAVLEHISKNHPDAEIDSGVFNAIIKAANSVIAECKRERVFAFGTMSPEQWLNSDDVGASSNFMCWSLHDKPNEAEHAVPHDGEDIGRCIRMVRACQLESKVNLMRDHGDVWNKIVDGWEQLCALYDSDNSGAIYEFLHG